MSAAPQREPKVVAVDISEAVERLNRLIEEIEVLGVEVVATQPYGNTKRIRVDIRQVHLLWTAG